ncbi:MAG: hypothetical protein ACRD6W_13515 [Nitrososphaerales archaeon]
MRKLLLGLAPLLAVVAFIAVPAGAQAATREYGTENAKGVFKAFTKATKVTDAKVSANFRLENEAKTADIECTTFSSEGTDENVGGIGKSKEVLTFDDCEGTGLLAGCVPNGTGIIKGEVTNEVLASGTEVEIKIAAGVQFDVECFGMNLGGVSGKAIGTQPAKSNVTTFAESKGLVFLGEPSTITGAAETKTKAATPKNVVIN